LMRRTNRSATHSLGTFASLGNPYFICKDCKVKDIEDETLLNTSTLGT
jgi:hypothetical protein